MYVSSERYIICEGSPVTAESSGIKLEAAIYSLHRIYLGGEEDVRGFGEGVEKAGV